MKIWWCIYEHEKVVMLVFQFQFDIEQPTKCYKIYWGKIYKYLPGTEIVLTGCCWVNGTTGVLVVILGYTVS